MHEFQHENIQRTTQEKGRNHLRMHEKKEQVTFLKSTENLTENQAGQYAKFVGSNYAKKLVRKVERFKQKVCK